MKNRDDALAVLRQYNESEALIRHAYAVEGVMRHFAERLGEDAEYWGLVGLLHDVDYEKWPEEHLKVAPGLLAEAGFDADFIRAVEAHGWGLCSDVKPEKKMEIVLYTIDELTGLITAAAYMRPSRSVMDMEVSSVKKSSRTRLCRRREPGGHSERLRHARHDAGGSDSGIHPRHAGSPRIVGAVVGRIERTAPFPLHFGHKCKYLFTPSIRRCIFLSAKYHSSGESLMTQNPPAGASPAPSALAHGAADYRRPVCCGNADQFRGVRPRQRRHRACFALGSRSMFSINLRSSCISGGHRVCGHPPAVAAASKKPVGIRLQPQCVPVLGAQRAHLLRRLVCHPNGRKHTCTALYRAGRVSCVPADLAKLHRHFLFEILLSGTSEEILFRSMTIRSCSPSFASLPSAIRWPGRGDCGCDAGVYAGAYQLQPQPVYHNAPKRRAAHHLCHLRVYYGLLMKKTGSVLGPMLAHNLLNGVCTLAALIITLCGA